MTAHEVHVLATRLAIEAGADPDRASERMAQLAQVYALRLALGEMRVDREAETLPARPMRCDDGCRCPECEPEQDWRDEHVPDYAYERLHSAARLG